MKKTTAKRLLLSVERIRDLQPSQLGQVAGGLAGDTADVCDASSQYFGGGGGVQGACNGTNTNCKTTAPSCAVSGNNSGL